MNYLQVEFEGITANQSEMLVALLADAGFESFEETGKALLACIREEDFDESSFDIIIQAIPANYKINVLPQQNWNKEWEQSFEPIQVNDFVAIRADFHQPVTAVKHEIIITPKMSFGTGHHATTYMMMQQMEKLDFSGKSVLDFGTGTAVLAILAEKMGAKSADAIDYDEWSIENAVENICTNHCVAISTIKDDKIATNRQYDIILANINLNVILDSLPAIKMAGNENSHILLSGFMKADEATMAKALDQAGMAVVNTLQKGEWICLHITIV